MTEVRPTGANSVPPSEMVLVPSVIEEFVSAAFGMFVKVFDAPDRVLLVSVSVVARPTSVSVLVGRVRVPVLTIVAMTGAVSVLFVSVSVVFLPTKVSVVEGRVNVPLLSICAIVGVVSVLFVSV